MSERSHQLKEQLREEFADIMLEALKTHGGVYLAEKEHYKLKEKLMGAVEGIATV